MESNLFISGLISTVGVALVCVVYFGLYLLDRRRYMLVWAGSWMAYSLAFALRLSYYFSAPNVWDLAVNQVFMLTSAWLLFYGTLIFVEQNNSRPLTFLFAAILAWTLTAPTFLSEALSLRGPSEFFSALLIGSVGIMVIRAHAASQFAFSWFVGVVIILRAILKFAYPFLLRFEWFSPSGYVAAWTLDFLIAMGLLILHFKVLSDLLSRNERRFRRLAEHARDGMFILHFKPKAHFVYFSPAALRITGYRPEEFLSNPRLPLHITHPEDMKQMHTLLAGEQDRDRPILLRIRHKERDYVWVEVDREYQYDASGNLTAIEGWLRDVHDREMYTRQLQQHRRELERSNEELQLVNRRLLQFTDSVANDLRTPLWRIGTFVKLLKEETVGRLTDSQYKYLDSIQTNGRRMSEFVNTIMSLTNLTTDTAELAQVNISNLAERFVADWSLSNTNRSIEATITPGMTASGSPGLLRLLIKELLANALSYSPTDSTARISLSETVSDGERTFVLQDNGIGFDPNHAERIFEPFHREQDAHVYGGPGLGLSLARRIVEAHGGRIWAESEPGKGATFYFTLGDNSEGKHIVTHG